MAELWNGGGLPVPGRQIIVRAVLGMFNAACMIAFREDVKRLFGMSAANFYAVFQASQFHLMYYASRTLPNSFAFGLSMYLDFSPRPAMRRWNQNAYQLSRLATLALRNLLPLVGRSPSSRTMRGRYQSALTLLTIAGVVFRSEIAVLLACHTVYLFLAPGIRLGMRHIIAAGVLGLAIGLSLTVLIDTFFWQSSEPLWPELNGFVFNVIEGKSEEWGTQSWHFYFTSALPRLLLNPLLYQVCIPFAVLTSIIRRPVLDVLIPNLAFVTIYSFLPHKEWRFVVYIVPPLLAVASAGASWIWIRQSKKLTYRILALAIIASTLASYAASGGMLAVSRLNYPGADALNRLHALASNRSGAIRVYLDPRACMSGITHFLEKGPPALNSKATVDEQDTIWFYDRTEDEEILLQPSFWNQVDYAIVEKPERIPGSWLVLEEVKAFAGVQAVRLATLDKPDLQQDLKSLSVVGQVLIGVVRGIWADKRLEPHLSTALRLGFEQTQKVVESFVTKRLTRGRWVRFKMEPRLRILQREEVTMEKMLNPVDADTAADS